MHRLLLVAVIGLSVFGTAPAVGQEWARSMFDESNIDFGTVVKGAKVEHRFVFTNKFKETVHISGVSSSCGCTTPRIEKDTLGSWEQSAIVATFNTHAFTGQKSATVSVHIDKPFHATVLLRVSGNIRTDLTVEPGAIDFGSVDQGRASSRTARVRYVAGGGFKISEARTAAKHVQVEVRETGRTQGSATYELVAKLDAGAPTGPLNEEITLVTSDPKTPEVTVAIRGQVTPEFSVSPSPILLGTLKPGQKVTKQVVVRGKRPFKVVKVECDGQAYEIKLPEQAKQVHILPLTFQAGEEAGKMTQHIRFFTDLGETFVVEATATATVVVPAAEGTTAATPAEGG